MGIPNVFEDLEDGEWDSVEPMEAGQAMPMEGGGEQGGQANQMQLGGVDQGSERKTTRARRRSISVATSSPNSSAADEAARGRAGGQAGEMSPVPLTPEQLAELLEKSVEIDLDALYGRRPRRLDRPCSCRTS
jgi:nitric oxide reductase NorD protein